MNFNDYNGSDKEKFLSFKYFFWATVFVVCCDAILGGPLLYFLRSIRGLGWQLIGH